MRAVMSVPSHSWPSEPLTYRPINGVPTWDSLADPFHQELDERLAPPPDGRILELACGDGARLAAFAAKAPHPSRVVGVDVNRQHIELARKHSDLHLVRAEPGAFLEFTPSLWDIITARFCLPVIGWQKLPRRAVAALAPGGRLGILSCLADSAPEAWAAISEMSAEAGIRTPSPLVPKSSDHLVHELQEAGFSMIDVETFSREVRFPNATEAVHWLASSGFGAHPWVTLLDVETLSHLGEGLAERLARHDDGAGIPLTFNIVRVVASAP